MKWNMKWIDKKNNGNENIRTGNGRRVFKPSGNIMRGEKFC